MVERAPHHFVVFKDKSGPGRGRRKCRWSVRDFSGRIYCHRRTLRDAQENADRMGMGLPRIPERTQILRRYPKLFMHRQRTPPHRYVITTASGYVIKRFNKGFKAEWWFNRYNEAREAKLARRINVLKNEDNDKILLDAVLEKWLLADSRMLYEERVKEIVVLLRMGLA